MERDPAAVPAPRIEELFARLADLPASERSAWLSGQSIEPELRQELESLLAADARADGIIGTLGPGVSGWIPPRPPRDASAGGPPIGSEISHYRLLAPLGRGGMGFVVRARDLRLHRDVALKFLPAHALGSPDARRRLLREARAAAALDHPNICTVYAVDEDPGGGLFIAMAYCEGETLAARIARGPLEVDDAIEVVEQLAAGLAAAHDAGIHHCDVKPSNVILTTTGLVKLVDFGIARAPTDGTGPGGVRGTLAYMAPEQIRGEAPDARTDVWAAGVLLLECVTGVHPFRGETDAVTMYRILGPPAFELPERTERREALRAVLARCLAPRPEGRFEHGEALRAALRELRRPSAPVRTAAPPTAPLPLPPTRLIGRETELRLLDEALRSARLVTVTGTAGTGKTRLVLDAVGRMAPRFRAGAVFVSLAAVTDPALVASAIATGLGLADEPTRAAADLLCEHLGEREVLIALDNFEQVVAAAPLLSGLLARCAGLRIVVTSRVPLRLRGERELPLDPLPLPPEGFDRLEDRLEDHPATALFLERARAIRADLVADGAAADAIVSICRRLDGLPLAIELAAAQVRIFPPPALLERLAQGLDALAGGARDLPGRHRTLRDAIAWSYRLLDPDERRVFRWTGVFAGGIDLQALERICPAPAGGRAVLPAVGTLVEHSLLLVSRQPGLADRPRFALLETIREYALERLRAEGEEDEARRLHAAYHLRLAEKGATGLTGHEQAFWLDRLEQEHDNLRTALDWAETAGQTETALRIGSALRRFWIARDHVREGLERLNRLIRMPAADDLRLRRAAVLAGAGSLVHETGDFPGAQPLLQEALTEYRLGNDPAGEAAVLNALAWTHAHTGSLEHADRVAREALRASRALGERRAVAVALHNLSWIAVYRGLPRRAIAHADAAIEIRSGLGDRRGAAFTLANRVRAERQAGELGAAERSLEQALGLAGELNDRQLRGLIHMVGGQVLLARGDPDAASAALREALGLWQGVRHDFAVGDCLNWLAAAEMELGRYEDAATRLAEATRIWERIRGPWGLAATLFRRGRLAQVTGRPGARELLERSLAIRREIGDLLGQAESLEAIAGCGEPDAAAAGGTDVLLAAGELRRAPGAP